jgi:hypothetical protein
MRARLIFVALVAFALGAAVDRFARITGHDHVIASQARQIELRDHLLREQKAMLDEINAVLRGDPRLACVGIRSSAPHSNHVWPATELDSKRVPSNHREYRVLAARREA